MQPNISGPFVVPPNSGRVLTHIGVTHKLTSQDTGGSYYLFESKFDPESGNRLHVHTYEGEVVYVLEGSIRIRLGDGRLEASQGGVVHLPKTIPHALYNPLKTPLRILALAIPGGKWRNSSMSSNPPCRTAGWMTQSTGKSLASTELNGWNNSSRPTKPVECWCLSRKQIG